MSKISFTTCYNNGCAEGLRNTCMFISIHNFLYLCKRNTPILDKKYSIKKLRELAEFPGSETAFFDIQSDGHIESLEHLLKQLDVEINIFYENVKKDDNGIVIERWINGNESNMIINKNGKHKMALLATGQHFELITSKTATTEQLYIVGDAASLLIEFDKLTKHTEEFSKMVLEFVAKKDADIESDIKDQEKIALEYNRLVPIVDAMYPRRKTISDFVELHQQTNGITNRQESIYEKQLINLTEQIKKHEDTLDKLKAEYDVLQKRINVNTNYKNDGLKILKTIKPVIDLK